MVGDLDSEAHAGIQRPQPRSQQIQPLGTARMFGVTK